MRILYRRALICTVRFLKQSDTAIHDAPPRRVLHQPRITIAANIPHSPELRYA